MKRFILGTVAACFALSLGAGVVSANDAVQTCAGSTDLTHIETTVKGGAFLLQAVSNTKKMPVLSSCDFGGGPGNPVARGTRFILLCEKENHHRKIIDRRSAVWDASLVGHRLEIGKRRATRTSLGRSDIHLSQTTLGNIALSISHHEIDSGIDIGSGIDFLPNAEGAWSVTWKFTSRRDSKLSETVRCQLNQKSAEID